MRIRLGILWFAICGTSALFLPTGEAASVDDENVDAVYVYRMLSHGGRIMIDEPRGLLFLDHFSVDASFCDRESRYYCVDSVFFSFAVPRDITSTDGQWEVDGRTYKLAMEPVTRGWFVEELLISVIIMDEEVAGKDWRTYFYYSPQIGLLAFQTLVESKDPSLVTLQGDIGFGAAEQE